VTTVDTTSAVPGFDIVVVVDVFVVVVLFLVPGCRDPCLAVQLRRPRPYQYDEVLFFQRGPGADLLPSQEGLEFLRGEASHAGGVVPAVARAEGKKTVRAHGSSLFLLLVVVGKDRCCCGGCCWLSIEEFVLFIEARTAKIIGTVRTRCSPVR